MNRNAKCGAVRFILSGVTRDLTYKYTHSFNICLQILFAIAILPPMLRPSKCSSPCFMLITFILYAILPSSKYLCLAHLFRVDLINAIISVKSKKFEVLSCTVFFLHLITPSGRNNLFCALFSNAINQYPFKMIDQISLP